MSLGGEVGDASTWGNDADLAVNYASTISQNTFQAKSLGCLKDAALMSARFHTLFKLWLGVSADRSFWKKLFLFYYPPELEKCPFSPHLVTAAL